MDLLGSGEVSATVDGWLKEHTVELKKTDEWRLPFTLDATTPRASFRLEMEQAVANLHTDCAVNILDAGGQAVRQTGEQIRARRRNQDGVRPARQLDVAHGRLVRRVEQLGPHRMAGECLKGHRRDEFERGRRHHNPHLGAGRGGARPQGRLEEEEPDVVVPVVAEKRERLQKDAHGAETLAPACTESTVACRTEPRHL